MKKIIKSLILILFIIVPINILASSEEYSNIDIKIYIDQYGTANVDWIEESNINSGTENYLRYENMIDQSITDFSVTKDGKKYSSVNNWNIHDTLENKAGKSGIIKSYTSYELCYGIEYGLHTYHLSFKINNFVTKNSSENLAYFTILTPSEIPTHKAKITISSFFPLNNATSDIFAYGYRGNIEFDNNTIVMYPTEKLTSYEYMTILARFSSNEFINLKNTYYTFTELQNIANEGITYWANKEPKFERFGLVHLLITILPYVLYIYGIVLITKTKKSNKTYGANFKKIGKKLTKLKKTDYDRNICLDMDLLHFNYIATIYNLQEDLSNILGGILLKWLKNNYIKMEGNDIHFINGDGITLDKEKELYILLKDAAATNGILEPNEFALWNKNNNYIMERWLDNYVEVGRNELVSKGYITETNNRYYLEEPIKEYGNRIQGFKHFIKDFSSVSDMNNYDVKLWDNYLIYATSLGMSSKIINEFKKVYPDYFDTSTISKTAIISINSYYSRSSIIHRVTSSSGGHGYSHGGGGRSFSGGGHHSGGFGGSRGRR